MKLEWLSPVKKKSLSSPPKKDDKTDKTNYRPVSTLPSISKIYERLLYSQIETFIENKLSHNQCGFRIGYSVQHCLIKMLEKWKSALDNKKHTGALLTDLSKAFDFINHDLMIAKLEAYGFEYKALKLIYSYLTNRYQRVNVNSEYSIWSRMQTGVPQGSILGSLLFNIYLSDLFLFFENKDIASYADDNTPYTDKDNMYQVIIELVENSKVLIDWINDNYMKANPDKFHIHLSSSQNELNDNITTINNDNIILNEGSEKLLGITIDNKLTFKDHVSNICKKASQKLHALARVSQYMDLLKEN